MPTPLYEMSVRPRGSPAGGSVSELHWPAGETLTGRGAALLLIHGYNNSREDARASFERFVKRLEEAARRSSLPWAVFGVQWPSDEKNKVHSTLAYASKIEAARESADRIFAYLRNTFGAGGAPVALHIVAHSLGCRVALEILERVAAGRPRPNVVLERLILMAAAVPEKWVEGRGPLREGAALTRATCVLHSTGDEVLRYAFPIGQTQGKDGFFPTAIGRFGRPAGTWLLSQRMASGAHLYDHSEYWPGAEAAAAAALFLGIPAERQLPEGGVGSAALPEPNAIAAHTIGSRKIGGRA